MIWIGVVAFCAGCTNPDNAAPLAVSNDLYLDYRISGEEDKEAVTCLVQVRRGGREGMPFRLPPPGSITLDGVPLPSDSAGISGAFYEMMIPQEDFAGEHTILFKNGEGGAHEQSFTWAPFHMAELPGALRRDTYRLQLEGWPGGGKVRLMLVDTSFSTDDVNRIASVENGELVLPPELMQNLAPGPIMMEIVREETRPLVQGTRHIGRLVISYSLRREFELEAGGG